MSIVKLVLLGIFILFILICAIRENNVMKTVDDYLDCIKSLRFEKSKDFILADNIPIIYTLHDLKNDSKSISNKIKIQNLDLNRDNILIKDRNFLDIAYIKAMDFDYTIISSDLIEEGCYNVKIQINLQDTSEFTDYVENLRFSNQHKDQEANFYNLYSEITAYIDGYDVKKSEIMTLKVIKQGMNYFVENPNKIYSVLSKPYKDFIEWR